MHFPSRRLPRSLVQIGAIVCALVVASSCTDISGDDDKPAQPLASNEPSTMLELTLMAGRYDVMLDQARTILKLPEPEVLEAQFPSGGGEELAERKALAAQQVRVAS